MRRISRRTAVGQAGGKADSAREAGSWVGRLLEGSGGGFGGRVAVEASGRGRGRRSASGGSIVEALKEGLEIREVDLLREALSVPMERLMPILGISKATWHRRRLTGRMGAHESDRVVRLARLFGLAAEALEGGDNARAWLTSPQFGLGGEVPLEHAGTEVGAREVEDLLGQIEHGVYG